MEYYNHGLCSAATSVIGISVILFTSDKSIIDQKLKLTYKINKIFKNIYCEQNIAIRGTRFLFQLIRAYQVCKKEEVNIIHMYIFHFSFFEKLQASIGKLFGFKIVATIHDIDSFDSTHIYNKKDSFIPFLDAIIFHNNFSKSLLLNKNPKFTKLNVAIVPPFDRDVTINAKNKIIKPNNVFNFYQKNRKYILFFGQIKEDKGVDLLIKAFIKLCNRIDNVDLIIAGKVWKTDFNKYQKLIDESEYKMRFILKLEFIEDEIVPLLFNISDVVVLPYKVIYNSSVIFRAMDYNSIILVSDLEPLTDIIEDGQNGYIFKSNDIKSLENRLRHVLSISHIQKHSILQNMKETLNNKFSIEATAIPLNIVYDNVNNVDSTVINKE